MKIPQTNTSEVKLMRFPYKSFILPYKFTGKNVLHSNTQFLIDVLTIYLTGQL